MIGRALVLLLLAAPASALDQPTVERFHRSFAGEFDNNLQVLDNEEQKVEHPHEWIHSTFKRVDLPAFGDAVYYVEQYLDGDPTKIYRQRLYQFANEPERLVLKILSFPDEKAVQGAHHDPTKLAGLTPEMMRHLPGCEVFWKPEGDAFVGSMTPNACKIVSQRSGKTLIISDDLRLDDDEIWIADRAVDDQGNYVFGNKAGLPHKLKRAQRFDCWLAVEKPGEGEKKEWDSKRGLSLHDQGGRFRFEREGQPTIGVVLEQRVYAGENTVPILKLALHEGDEKQSKAYSWAAADSDRVGINIKTMQAGCTRVAP